MSKNKHISAAGGGRMNIFEINSGKLEKEMIAVDNEWCSINHINKTAKVTPLSWKYMHLEKKGEKYYFSDMEGFEACEQV